MGSLLQVEGLHKVYGDLEAVKGISFDIHKGEIVGFIGPNGAGKSSTIHMISTIVDTDRGEVFFEGQSTAECERAFKRSLGVVPQDIALFSDLTAYSNVKFFCSLYGVKGAQLKAYAKEALEKVGLWDRKDDYPGSFSGGMKRRLNIACSIAHKPKLLIMDEPTVGIDPQSRHRILELTKQLVEEQGIAVIYTSHYMEEIEAICSRLIMIDHGVIIEQGSTEELTQKYFSQGLHSLEDIFLHVTGEALRD